jgi:DNA-binding CsgD family transcriptional regulator
VRRPDAGPAGALAALSARQRTVLVLRYWEDLTEAGIAELLGCSPGTVTAHLRAGLAVLRAHSAFSASDGPAAVSALDVRDRPLTLPGVRR